MSGEDDEESVLGVVPLAEELPRAYHACRRAGALFDRVSRVGDEVAAMLLNNAQPGPLTVECASIAADLRHLARAIDNLGKRLAPGEARQVEKLLVRGEDPR